MKFYDVKRIFPPSARRASPTISPIELIANGLIGNVIVEYRRYVWRQRLKAALVILLLIVLVAAFYFRNYLGSFLIAASSGVERPQERKSEK